ncbi:unnamed protein product [Calypogeia fissa]
MEEIGNILWPDKPEISVESSLLRWKTEKQASRVIYLLLDLTVGSLNIPEEAMASLLGDQQKQNVNGKIRVNHYPICDHPQLTWIYSTSLEDRDYTAFIKVVAKVE